ncbi:major facilitator superfamily domain-containing protein [Xylariales sp. AK1849]|nr:major facilitator superfamily domain-containing protein [Xylariales sp. AK1849]
MSAPGAVAPSEARDGQSVLDEEKNNTSRDATTAETTDLSDSPKSASAGHGEKPSGQDGKPAGSIMAIPNGGAHAWLQVAGAFMVFFNTWGVLNTFGVFQTYYESGDLFAESSSNISWIGSIQAYFVLLGGVFSGPLYDKGYFRSLLILGSFGIVFGHMMLSLCHAFWQVLLAQGFCIGLGAGLLFVPSLAVLPTYFNTRIGVAVGIAASGSSFGGIIYPIVFYRLIGQIGFAWSVRVLGFIALAVALIPIIFMKQRIRPPRARALIDWSAFTDWPWLIFVVSCMIGFIGLYVLIFYISYYGQATSITDASLSFYLVAILNAGSMFGRTLPNALSDKTGPFNMIIPGAFICGILVLCMQAVHSVGAIVVLALLFGFFSGVFIAIPPVIFVALTKDKSRIGTRIGMGFAIIGFGTLIGGPGGGAVLGQTGDGENWNGLWIFGGVTMIVAGFLFVGLRCWKYGAKLMTKA